MRMKLVLKKGTRDWVLKVGMRIPKKVLLCGIKKRVLVAMLLIPLFFIQAASNTSDPEKVEVFENICAVA